MRQTADAGSPIAAESLLRRPTTPRPSHSRPGAFSRCLSFQLSAFNFPFSAFDFPLSVWCTNVIAQDDGMCFTLSRRWALALDTDPGVVPNQKQGAKRGLRHKNEAYQTSYTSKPRRKLLEINGCIDVYRVLRVQSPLIYVTYNTTLKRETA